MAFLPHLQAVVAQVEGAWACSIMGFDGIAVETHQVERADDVELQSAWVEFSGVLTQLKGAAGGLKTGAVSEVCINTEKLTTVLRLVSPDYFIALALRPEGNFGKARYVLRVTAPKVRAEL